MRAVLRHGSCIGLYKTGTAAAGVLGEEPKKFGKVMVLVLLPATQGIYGFIIGLIASAQLKAGMDTASGWAVFAAVMPMAISGLISRLYAGKVRGELYLCGRQAGISFR